MKKRILLADDSVTIQKVIELTFLDEDYQVSAYSNGDEALANLAEVDPDFVIADVHMPGANGYEVCRQAKERKPGVPVLLLVGTFEPFDEAKSREVGADSFLKKPFDSQELLHRVHELLASAEPTQTLPAPADVPAAAPAAAPEAPGEIPEVAGEPVWGNLDLDAAAVDLGVPAAAPTDLESAFDLGVAEEPESPFDLGAPAPEPPFDFAAPLETAEPFDREPSFELEPLPVGEAEPEAEPVFTLDEEEPAAPEELILAEPEDVPYREAAPFDRYVGEEPAAEPEAAFSLETPSWEEEIPATTAPTAEAGAAEPELTLPEEEEPPSFAATPSFTPEAEEVPAVPAPPAVPATAAGTVTNGRLGDEEVDRIARRVVELLGDKAVRDVAWEVVPDLAEVIIRDRLRELESQVE
jgi:DNA-binding response OmpR family regulator